MNEIRDIKDKTQSKFCQKCQNKHTALQIRFVGGDLISQPSCTTSRFVLDIIYNIFVALNATCQFINITVHELLCIIFAQMTNKIRDFCFYRHPTF